ncbi:MAG: riboflavin biosynthesis protein RibF [Prevotellaceae bacterium]|nr:riboflavin biosynthesis protein RibF [Candidatus Colivivens equi]MCQ2077301.1 riboflavin biosynthesis protein RibF [Bacteroidaceae bacterium]
MKVATIGFFDGVHRGHRFLIQSVIESARALRAQSVLITFNRHPLSVLHSENSPELLTLEDERQYLLRQTGVDEIVVLPFSTELSLLSARDFMAEVLKERLGVTTLILGYDHHFGNKNMGHDYESYGRELGIEILRCGEVNGVSSSLIRSLLLVGDIKSANESLGYNYFIRGIVVHGHHLGRTIGFPTANLDIAHEKLLPREGAYCVRVVVGEYEYDGMMNIGRNAVEVHLLDFEGNLYGKRIEIKVTDFIRSETEFTSLDELKNQLEKDKQYLLCQKY